MLPQGNFGCAAHVGDRMKTGRFEKFCVVGIGGHARTKLIPAIKANGQQLIGVVSTQPAGGLPKAAVFSRLQDAVEALPRDTAFFVATPPAAHFDQARLIVQNGFDLFLEKPAFVTRRDAEEIISLCEQGSSVLVEGFMHRYTRLYSELLELWASSRDRVRRVGIKFLIDKMPPGTFRSESHIASSGIFDIGCYAVSLLSELGLGRVNLELSDVQFAGDPDKMRTRIAGSAGRITIDIDIGVSDVYSNCVCLEMTDGEAICFAPFFYGRKAERSISISSGGNVRTRRFPDDNAFEAMLARPREVWQQDQGRRCLQMVEVAERLEALARGLRGFGAS